MLNTREGLSDPDDFEAPFRDKLTDLEGVPPEESWAAIQTALDHNRGIDRRWYLLLLLLLVGSGGFIGGFWVSQVRQERQVARVNEGGEQIKSQSQDLGVNFRHADGGRTLMAEDCSEACEPGVERTGAGEETDAKSYGTDKGFMDISTPGSVAEDRTNTASNTGVNRRLTAQRGVGGNHGKDDGIQSAEIGSIVRGARSSALPGTASAEENNRRLAAQHHEEDDGHDAIVASQSKTPVAVTGNDDSTEVNGPMPYLHPHYGGVNSVSAAGVDSVQSVDELAAAPVAEKTDSTGEMRTEVKSSKWTLQLSAGGNYIFKKLTPSEDLFYITDLTNKNKFSRSNAGYHLAARVRREVGTRTTLVAGVSWSQWQTNIDYKYYDVVADSVEVQQVTSNTLEVKTFFAKHTNEIHTTLQQMGLSVGVLQKVKVLRREHRVLLEANLYQKIYTASHSGEPGHNISVQAMSFAVKAGVEKAVDIGAWHFTLTPYVQHYLSSVYTSESVFQFKPLQVGLDLGVLLPLSKK